MKNFYHISILRFWALILMILAHCSHLYTDDWIYVSTIKSPFWAEITKYIYTFHMPLFVFISGYMYFNFRNLNKYSDLKDFFYKKFNRLIIPFLVVGIFLMIPIYQALDIGAKSTLDAYKLFFLGSNTGHLWFLLMLFELFVFFRCLEPIINKQSVIFNLLILIGLNIISYKLTSYFQINKVFLYAVYFYLGSIVCNNDKFIRDFVLKHKYFVFILFLFQFLLLLANNHINNENYIHFLFKLIYKFIKLGLGVTGILISYFIVQFASNKMTENKYFKFIKDNLFRIYLIHEPILFILLSYLANKSISPTLLVISCFVFVTLTSLGVSLIINKLKQIILQLNLFEYQSN